MAGIFMMLAATLMVTAANLVTTARKDANDQAYSVALAENAAQAGLEDAIGWFKRQPVQPVAANGGAVTTVTYPVTYNGMAVSFADQVFNPVFNTANPVTTDTIDPTGNVLANEFSPDGAGSVSEATTIGDERYWERYEVQKQLPATASMPNAVHDITGNRAYGKYTGQGLVWSISSTGYVYYRKDFSKSVSAPYYWTLDYKTYPNKLLGTARMSTEIRKLSTTMPWGLNAALYTPNIHNLNLSTNTVVSNQKQPSSYAWAAVSQTSNNYPVTSGANEVQGSGLVTCGTCSLPLAAGSVFGMSVTDLQNVADNIGGTSQPLNFSTLGNFQLTTFNGNLVIDPGGGNPNYILIGAGGIQTGVLIVNGNFTMKSAGLNMNNFYGLVYVTGAVTLAGSSINGALIMDPGSGGNVVLTSVNGIQGAINYNPSLLKTLQSTVTQYREDISSRKKFLAIPGM